jgi:hypothetical protein
MKIIINVEITRVYERWKQLFLSVDAQRERYGIKALAYGHPKNNENKIYQVLEMDSMDNMQKAKLSTDAGVNLDSQEVVCLVE